MPSLSLSLNTEPTKRVHLEALTEDEPQKEPKPTPQNEPDDAFGFIPGDFIPGGQL
jgi:hypothetical protein